MKKQKTTKIQHHNLLIAGAVAAAVAGGIVWYTVQSEPDVAVVDLKMATTEETKPANNEAPANVPPAGDMSQLKGKNLLNVGPQEAGTGLIVDLVNLVNPGFVVIHQANNRGQAGAFEASSYLLKGGTREDIVVNANLKSNTTYVVTLRNDDGDGKFNAEKDLVLSDTKGQPVILNITTAK